LVRVLLLSPSPPRLTSSRGRANAIHRCGSGLRLPHLQAANPLGVDRPDAASPNSTGPLTRASRARGGMNDVPVLPAPMRPRLSPARAPATVLRARTVRPAGSRRGRPCGRSRVATARPDDARSMPPFGVGRSTPGVNPGGLHEWATARRRRIGLSAAGLRHTPHNSGPGRPATASIDAAESRLNRPAHPSQVPTEAQRHPWGTRNGLHVREALRNEVREEPP